MRNREEERLHAALAMHLRKRAPDLLWWHCPNGGARNIIEATKFKRLGVLAGVPDILAIHNGEIFGLELKARGRRPTEVQDEFADKFKAAGGHYFWTDDLDVSLNVFK